MRHTRPLEQSSNKDLRQERYTLARIDCFICFSVIVICAFRTALVLADLAVPS